MAGCSEIRAHYKSMKKFTPFLLLVLFSCSNCDEKSKQENSENAEETSPEAAVSIVAPSGETLYNYMNHPGLNPLVKDYLEGDFVPDNDERTRVLLDTLVNHQGELTSLYFGIFSKICKESNEGLSEILGPFSLQLLEKHTKFCVASLKNGAPDYFTGYISNEFHKRESWENEFKIYSEKLYANVGNNPELIRELNHLTEGIRNDIDHLQQGE
jgi:hypothetical protein